MGKRGGPPDIHLAYNDLFKPTEEHMWATLVDEIGLSFISGTGGGFLYHLVKQQPSLTKALANAPRVGGFCTLFSLSTAITSYALYNLRGRVLNKLDDYVSVAAGAAIVCSPRGFRTASIAASITAGWFAYMDYSTACDRRDEAQMAMAKAFHNNPY